MVCLTLSNNPFIMPTHTAKKKVTPALCRMTTKGSFCQCLPSISTVQGSGSQPGDSDIYIMIHS